MNPTNHATVMERIYGPLAWEHSSPGVRVVLIILLCLLVQVLVVAVRRLSEWLIHKSNAHKHALDFVTRQPKFVTLIQLIASGVTFTIYFLTLGLVLQQVGLNLKGYLASASIVALAISFGSQGLVQDVVISLTLIFSDAMDVGDMVEIYANTTIIGRVEQIGMRFTMVSNLFNQVVFIPNRTIANVSRFPHGGVYAYADIQVPAEADRNKLAAAIKTVARGMWGQFGAIILSEPAIGPEETTPDGGWRFVRIQFKIWPGQGALIETTFRGQIVRMMKTFEPDYADWQVVVTYRNIATSRKL